jgi:hypothetical protein
MSSAGDSPHDSPHDSPMTAIGVISNPHSHRNLRDLAAVREIVAQDPTVVHVELEHMSALAPALADFARRGIERVVVNGGDGTVHGVMTALLNSHDFARMPDLALLPAGRTNLIAHDLGLKGRPVDGLTRLLSGTPLTAIDHPVLTLHPGGGAAPLHGMFFGTAAFYRGTMLARAKYHPMGATGRAVVGLSLASSLLRALIRRGGEDGIYRGDDMTLAVDDGAGRDGSYLLVMATTLDRLLLGVRPFWGDGPGAVRLTTIDFPPARLVRALAPMLRGWPRPWMEAAGYQSRRAGRVTIHSDCPMILDGQIIHPDPVEPAVLEGDRRLRFVRC